MLCTAVQAASETGWPSWRGPVYNGSILGGAFPTKLDANQPTWKAPLPGKGTSTPIVHGERVYLTSPSGGEDAVVAFDFTGKKVWETKLGPETPPKHRSLASSGNASPVTDGTNLFVYFKSGNFAALSLEGKVTWKTNLVEAFGREQLFWDQGTSPMLTDKHVVMARMHSGESWIAGFDKGTGALAWKESRNYSVPNENDNGYTTPVLFKADGKDALLVWGADHLTAHDASNGKKLWELGGFNPKQTGYWPYIASPVIVGDIAVIPVGRDDRGQAAVEGVKLGSASATRLWRRDDTGVFVPSPAAHDGRVYLLRNRGEVACLDPATGKTHWTGQLADHRTPYYSSPTIAGGHLYAAREDGTVFVAKVGDKFEKVSETAMNEQIIASVVPAAGRLFIRTSSHLWCFGGN
ncbi:MAG TPA: PQQ-binding-like beta-propeller repeat protein [Methylomirabilota bacterium]|nr:PQQ-binding-like beta-propeller repeat protein [Methylomirabilota bacterium]